MKPVNLEHIKKILPSRSKTSSKIDGGKVLIIAGGKDFFGAGILTALAATKTGAGYTHLMTDFKEYPWLEFPDFIVHPFSLSILKKHTQSVIGIGPGLGMTELKKKILVFLIKNKFGMAVVDGDALTILSKMIVQKLPSTWILTPHEGELARLLDTTSIKIKADRLHYVIKAQRKYGCTVILKGADTLIATSDKVYLVNAGTKALAKAGSGDVLVGVISALCAQGLTSTDAAIAGCFMHGYASKLWIDKKNDYLGMRPVELIEMIPKAMFKIRKTQSKVKNPSID
jgi:ADP-dependent NAD(P)H-hydrate dehydratase